MSKRIRSIITLWLLLCSSGSFSAQAFIELEGQYDPDISASGVRAAFGGVTDPGLRVYLATSYRFGKDYLVSGNPVTADDFLTEIGAGLPFRPFRSFSIEPFGAVHLSNYYFDYGTMRYIELLAPQYEYGVRLQLTRSQTFQPYVRWSQKTGLFAGDSTTSFGVGISMVWGKVERFERAEQAEELTEEEQVPTYRKSPVGGYFVVRSFDRYPDEVDLNPRLVNPLVKRWLRKNEDGRYQLFIGPFSSLEEANTQRMYLGFFRARTATIWEGKLLDLKIPTDPVPDKAQSEEN